MLHAALLTPYRAMPDANTIDRAGKDRGAAFGGTLEAPASQPELAASLHNLPVLLSDLDRPEDALAAGEEAVTIAGS
jgi:hypothetical protein